MESSKLDVVAGTFEAGCGFMRLLSHEENHTK
jgi:hypothetical protein